MLQAGIVGLPNVGKSTLFNAVTKTRKASKSEKLIPTAIEFVDIAGLVEGASEGAGLGNKFLSNIREVDAILQVVRCFENDDIIHELGSVDPLRDIDIINSELILADIAVLDKRRSSRAKKAKSGDKESVKEVNLIDRLLPHLNDGKPALTLDLNDDERAGAGKS